jgi:hypothetical protein
MNLLLSELEFIPEDLENYVLNHCFLSLAQVLLSM